MPFNIDSLIPLAALSIPIIAITLGIGGGIIEKIIKSQERKFEMRLKSQQNKSGTSNAEIEALRQEIAALRDTSTQFDVSLSSSVERLEQRVSRVEVKQAATGATSDETQTIGRR